jgi:hypothetical protein
LLHNHYSHLQFGVRGHLELTPNGYEEGRIMNSSQQSFAGSRHALQALILGVTLVAGQQAGAQGPEDMVNCVSLSQVDRTEVIDDTTILFYMRGNRIYRNVLPHRCPGLNREQAFMYRVTTSQLCNVDVITVLDRIGAGFMPGASCGLGKFQPISEAAVEELKAVAERSD